MTQYEFGNLKGGARVFRWDDAQDKAIALMVVETIGQGTAFVQVPAGLVNNGVPFIQGIQPDQIHPTEADAIQYGLDRIEERHAERCVRIQKALKAAQSRES